MKRSGCLWLDSSWNRCMWVCVCRNQSFHHYPCRPRHTEVGSGCLGAVGLGEMWRSEALALSFPCVFCRVSSILQMARFWSSVKTIPMVLLQRSSHVSASGWFCSEGELGRTDVSVLLFWEEKPIFVFSKPDFGFCWHSFGSSFLGGAVHDPHRDMPRHCSWRRDGTVPFVDLLHVSHCSFSTCRTVIFHSCDTTTVTLSPPIPHYKMRFLSLRGSGTGASATGVRRWFDRGGSKMHCAHCKNWLLTLFPFLWLKRWLRFRFFPFSVVF